MVTRAGTKTKPCSKCQIRRPLSAFVGERGKVCAKCRKANTRRSSRALRLKKTYGITDAEDLKLAEVQDKRCAGCVGRRGYYLHVDHDHTLEKLRLAAGDSPQEAARKSVRGKLCARCNGILRDCRDDPGTLERLAAYLRVPPARKVLGT